MATNSSLSRLVFISIVLLISFTTCKKEALKVAPTVVVSAATNITSTSASSGGEITSDGGATITARGVCWSTVQDPTTADNKTSDGTGLGSFTSSITGLTPGATYKLKAYAINSAGTAYSSQSSFTTLALLPVLTTTVLSAVTSAAAASGGNITSDGGSAITARGVCWSTTTGPTTAGSKSTDGTGTGSFTSSITELTAGTTYFVRAYATNSAGTAYGSEVTFSSSANLPALSTVDITSITPATASGGGNVTSAGGGTITARGVCWSTATGPTTAGSKSTDGTGTGGFTSSITGLTAGTTYFVRAYATNSAGTAYGSEVTFSASANLPVVTTEDIKLITSATASGGGKVTSAGGGTITARGVCWSTTTGPTTAGSKSIDGTGTDSFTSSITGLTAATTYYVRAYATNSAGTAYGNEVTFSSSANLPVLSTADITSITSSTATGGGNVTSAGGGTITARGVCWSTTTGPTTAGSKSTDGTGTGSFTSSITGLTAGTTYFVRAYATNSAGTAYGNEVTFSSSANLPVLSTAVITSITSSTASGGGNVTSDGGGTIAARGVCWSTATGPTTAGSKSTDGTGTGSFTSSITGLTAGTTYFVRAYATNSAGTAYGSEVTLLTSQLSDIDGNNYNIVTIGTQVWMASNLKTTKFNDGTDIPLVTVNTAWTNLITPGYCWYNNAPTNKDPYGALYNWYAVNTGKLCPTGWHVPSEPEWTTLATFLGGVSVAGGKLKETGTSHWLIPNTGATNQAGFTALPGGARSYSGASNNIGEGGWYYSSSEYSTSKGLYRFMYYGWISLNSYNDYKQTGLSVRCLRDF